MDVMDDEELEEAADGEVDKVLYELTAGKPLSLIFCTCFCIYFDTVCFFLFKNITSNRQQSIYEDGM